LSYADPSVKPAPLRHAWVIWLMIGAASFAGAVVRGSVEADRLAFRVQFAAALASGRVGPPAPMASAPHLASLKAAALVWFAPAFLLGWAAFRVLRRDTRIGRLVEASLWSMPAAIVITAAATAVAATAVSREIEAMGARGEFSRVSALIEAGDKALGVLGWAILVVFLTRGWSWTAESGFAQTRLCRLARRLIPPGVAPAPSTS
jgi:hypothetical protein